MANRADLKFGYVVEKLAALKVMAGAPIEGYSGDDIYGAVAQILEYDSVDKVDDSARGAIRNFIQSIQHGNSPLFIGEGKTKARRYKPNPKARVRPIVEYQDEELRAMESKVQRRLTGKMELSDVDTALVDVGDLTMFLGWIEFNKIVAEHHIQLQDESLTANLRTFLDNRSDWLDMLSEVAEKTDGQIGEEDVEARRLAASEKLFTLLDKPKVLKRALKKLEIAQEENVELIPIVEIMEVMAEFCEDEKRLLREIIETRLEEIYRETQETPSSAKGVDGIWTLYHIGSKTYRFRNGSVETITSPK